MNEDKKPKRGTPEWRAQQAAKKRAARHARAAAEGRVVHPRRTGPRDTWAGRELKPCGTSAAARRGCSCDACLEGYREDRRQQARRRHGFKPRAATPLPKHGTTARRHRGCSCERCRTAHAAYSRAVRAWRAARVAAGQKLRPRKGDVPHGTYTGYAYWRCRCAECYTAARVRWREWEQREIARRAERRARKRDA